MNGPLWIDEPTIARVLPYRDAVAELTAALASAEPPRSPARQVVETAAGQILLMPAEWGPFAGVKVVTVAPANAGRGLPRINGVYVLFDAATLVPVGQFDA